MSTFACQMQLNVACIGKPGTTLKSCELLCVDSGTCQSHCAYLSGLTSLCTMLFLCMKRST